MKNEIKSIIQLSTIPIQVVNKSTKLPEYFASGCFVYYKGNLVFLTINHIFERDDEDWDEDLVPCILVDYDDIEGRMILESLKNTSPIVKGNIMEDGHTFLDFRCKKIIEMPPCKYLESEDGEHITRRIDRLMFISDLDTVPNASSSYSFAGLVYPNLFGSAFVNIKIPVLKQQPIFYSSLKYKGLKDDYYVFSMPNDDYEFADFTGTSGAPIIDERGKLVSLVVKGGPSQEDSSKWLIYGINLQKFKCIIDVECDII